MTDFADYDYVRLNFILGKFKIHKALSDRASKFNCVGRPNDYQELERKGIVYTSHKGDRVKQKYYWWYLTDTGLEIIESMLEMEEL